MTILHKSTGRLDKILAVYYRKVLKFLCETGNIESIEPQKSVDLQQQNHTKHGFVRGDQIETARKGAKTFRPADLSVQAGQ